MRSGLGRAQGAQRKIQPAKRSFRFHTPRRGYQLSSKTPAARTAPRGRSLSASEALRKPPSKRLTGTEAKSHKKRRKIPSREVAGSRVPKDIKRPNRACNPHTGSERPERGGTQGDRTQVPTATELLEEGKLGACLPSKRGPGTLAVSKEASRMRQERYDGGHCLYPSPSGEPRLPAGPCRSDGRQAKHRSGAGAAELTP